MADDILMRPVPALSATSDMPVIEPAPEPEPPKEPENAPAPETEGQPAAQQEPAPEGGEGKAAPEDPPQAAEPVAPPPKVDPRTRKIREQEAEISALRARDAERDARMERLLAALEKPQPETKPVEQPASPPPRPQRDAFDDPAAYDAALIEWSTQRALETANAEAAKRAEETKAADDKRAQEQANAEQWKQLQSNWQTRRAAALEKYPDYTEIAEDPTLPVSAPMGIAIVASEHGPEIAMWLGQNRAEAERISKIADPGRVMYEMGLVAAKALQPTRERPQVSRVPAPIVPVGNRSTAAAADPETQSGDEYFESRIGHYRKDRASVGRVN